mgnify:CR=1 FL=1
MSENLPEPDSQTPLVTVWNQALDQAVTSGTIDPQQRTLLNLSQPIALVGETFLVIVPSSAVDTMNLGGMSGMVSLAQQNQLKRGE